MEQQPNDQSEIATTEKVSFNEIVRIIVLKPTTELYIVTNQKKYSYTLLFPILYGIISGINKSLNAAELGSIQHLTLGYSISGIVTSILLTLFVCFVYSWIVLFISNRLDGDAGINMTYAIVSYSLIPMIIGAIIFMSVHTFVLAAGVSMFGYKIMYYSQLIFLIWSLFILTISNAVINNFIIGKSLIATSAIVVIIILLAIFSK